MKKFLAIVFILTYCIAYAQFTVAEKSSDWNQVSKYTGDVVLYRKDNLLKINLKDVRSVKMTSNVLNPSKTVFDDIYKEQKKANEGIRDGYYEMILSIEKDTTDKLYSVIEGNLKNKNIETLTLQFPEGNLYLRFYKDMFQYLVSIGLDNNGTLIYSDGYSLAGIKNVFGKNKK